MANVKMKAKVPEGNVDFILSLDSYHGICQRTKLSKAEHFFCLS